MSMSQSTPPPADTLRGLAQLAVFLLLAAGLPALIPYHPKEEPTSSRDAVSIDDEIDRLEAARAEVVVIGNSMVPCRIDPELATRLTGKRFSLLSFDGSASAGWFLLVKNVVAEMDPPPGTVVLFFRDTIFHFPAYRTTGQREPFISSLRVGAEPELDRALLLADRRRSPVLEGAADLVDGFWPADGYQARASTRLSDLAMDLTKLGDHDKDARRDQMDQVFALDNLREDLAADFDPEKMRKADSLAGGFPEFTTSPEDSLLTPLLDICRAHDIELVLFRVRRRVHSMGRDPREPQEVTDYVAAMKAWAEGEGIPWVDESYDPALSLDHFADGDHIKPDSLDFWTRTVVERLKPVLNRKQSPGGGDGF